jgi:hypothetical protein
LTYGYPNKNNKNNKNKNNNNKVKSKPLDLRTRVKKAPLHALSQLELDALCPWFKDGDECLLKIDHSFENGRRVIGITSNETDVCNL